MEISSLEKKQYTIRRDSMSVMINHLLLDHSRIFFPQFFFSVSHADSSFVGASDIGQ